MYFRSTNWLEVIHIAILFSEVKVQSADPSETFLISGIPKEYDDLTDSIQFEWFLQDIDSDKTVQVHALSNHDYINAKMYYDKAVLTVGKRQVSTCRFFN